MTVNSVSITSGPYTGTGSTSQFNYSFRIDDKAEVKVFETDNSVSPGVVAELVVDVDYTVNNIGTDGGGSIDRTAGVLPVGDTWFIRSDRQALQDVDFASQGGFFPDTHEGAFDLLIFLLQQHDDLIARTIGLPESYSGGASLQLPEPESLKIIQWNEAGDGLENGPAEGTIAGYASDASDSEIAAAANAAAAALSETNAGNSEGLALTHQSNANTSELNAATSEGLADADAIQTAADRVQTGLDVTSTDNNVTAAQAAQAAAELALDQFDDRYLGEKASDPTLDNDGNALIAGAEYWNTVSIVRKTWTGSAWIISGAASAAGIINIPAGGISATDVQSALNELDGEKISNGNAILATDFDAINENGFHYNSATSTTGAPDTQAWWVVLTIRISTNGLVQYGQHSTTDTGVYIRRKTASVWQAWRKLIDENDIDAAGGVQSYDADTAKLDVNQVWDSMQAGKRTTLTDAATIVVDLSQSNFYQLTLAGNRTLENPTGEVTAQSGSIWVAQDATGGRTLAIQGQWKTVGGVAPVFSTAANAVDRIDYVVKQGGQVNISVALDVK